MDVHHKTPLTIIDQDTSFLSQAGAFFKQNGFSIKTFEKEDLALIELEKYKENSQVILCSAELSHISIENFITKTLRIKDSFSIIVLSNDFDIKRSHLIESSGADAYLLKPITFKQIHFFIQKILFSKKIHQYHLNSNDIITQNQHKTLPLNLFQSFEIQCLSKKIMKLSGSLANVLITGESGTGKEVVAQTIHFNSPVKKGPFIAINCSAIPENLLESELFGHAKGSFTGATDHKKGLFEESQNGTLFLDEIGDLPLNMQVKLLRVIQERSIKRIGENHHRKINVRIICATHKDLQNEIKEKKFREDLYYRLHVISFHLPPLRERKDDIIPLSLYFINKLSQLNNKEKVLSTHALEKLSTHFWRGNIRELENTLERSFIFCETKTICANDILMEHQDEHTSDFTTSTFNKSISQHFDHSHSMTLEEMAKKYILTVYNKNHGAKEKTAKELGIDRKTLYRKLKDIRYNDYEQDYH